MTAYMSSNELHDLEATFSNYDRDGDGLITASDLGQMMRSLGRQVTDNEMRQVIAQVDVNGSGAIEFSEFVAMMRTRSRNSDTEQDIRDAFSVFDRDGNGFISAYELRTVMSKFGSQLTQEDVEDMIRIADTNDDGFVNIDEFVKMVMSR